MEHAKSLHRESWKIKQGALNFLLAFSCIVKKAKCGILKAQSEHGKCHVKSETDEICLLAVSKRAKKITFHLVLFFFFLILPQVKAYGRNCFLVYSEWKSVCQSRAEKWRLEGRFNSPHHFVFIKRAKETKLWKEVHGCQEKAEIKYPKSFAKVDVFFCIFKHDILLYKLWVKKSGNGWKNAVESC